MSREFCLRTRDCLLLRGHPGECSPIASWDNEPTNYRPLKLTRLGCLAICFLFFVLLLVAYAIGGREQGTPGNYCVEYPDDSVCQGVK